MKRHLNTTFAGLLCFTLGCGKQGVPPRADAFVVSLHDTTTEIVVRLGAQDRLAAIADPRYLSPESLRATAELTRVPEGPISAEAIAQFNPRLVLGTDTIEERQPGLRPALERLGIEVLWIDPRGFTGLAETIIEVGRRLGLEQRGNQLAHELTERLKQFEARTVDTENEPIRVFFYDCCDPPFTAGGRAPLSELLTRVGARNIFEDLDQDWGAVSWEAVIERVPELIVVHDYAWGDQAAVQAKIAGLYRRTFLAELPAIHHFAVVSMPLGLALEGPRNLDALEWLLPSILKARAARGGTTR